MGKQTMYRLRDMLCEELDGIAQRGELSAGDLDTVHKLTDTIKNIDKIENLEGGYSEAGDWMAEGTYRNGDSYAGRGRRSYRGYSRNNGRMYSRAESKDEMIRRMEEMMEDDSLSSNERNALIRALDIMRT